MSLYGMVVGSDRHKVRLNEILRLGDYDTGRYRDTYVRHFKEHDFVPDGIYILLLTRNGGGNREEYQTCFDNLQTHPNYVADWDCDWDATYAEICFSIPENYHEEVLKMTSSKDPGQKFEDFIESMEKE